MALLDRLEPHGKDNLNHFLCQRSSIDVRSGNNWYLARLNSGLKFFSSQPVTAGIVHAVYPWVDQYNGYYEIIGNAVDVRSFCATEMTWFSSILPGEEERRLPNGQKGFS